MHLCMHACCVRLHSPVLVFVDYEVTFVGRVTIFASMSGVSAVAIAALQLTTTVRLTALRRQMHDLDVQMYSMPMVQHELKRMPPSQQQQQPHVVETY